MNHRYPERLHHALAFKRGNVGVVIDAVYERESKNSLKRKKLSKGGGVVSFTHLRAGSGDKPLGNAGSNAVYKNYYGTQQINAAQRSGRGKRRIGGNDAELIPGEAAEKARAHKFKPAPENRLNNKAT